MKASVAVILAAWLGFVLVLGASGGFISPLGTIPLRIAVAAAAPILVFLALYWMSEAFRAFVLAIDLPLATAVQAWRFAGFAFLALYAHGVLPGVFVWPAGLGDMAIGITALGLRSHSCAGRTL